MASGLALGKDAAVADDISVVANTQGFANIVVGDQNTDASFLQEMHDALNFNHRNRVDTGKRFVEQNKTRTSGQGAGDFSATAFPAGNRRRQVLANTGNLEFV